MGTLGRTTRNGKKKVAARRVERTKELHPAIGKLAVALKERDQALQQQAATAEILKVISSSPTDLAPVFDAILASATRLCDAHLGLLNLREDDKLRTVAQRGGAPEFVKWVSERGPFKPSLAIAMETRQPIQIPDITETPAFKAGVEMAVKFLELGGARTYLTVPLLKDGTLLGSISIYRPEVRPFTDQQIELVKTFANQAVIAIENVRLFNETKEALEQQTATAEILRVISSSPDDIQPVFASILEHAMRLCDASLGTVGLHDGKTYTHVAQRGGSSEYVKWLFSEAFEPATGSTIGRMIAERRPVHIHDYRELASYREGNPRAVATVELGGARTYLAIPMLREGRVLGAITIRRAEVKPFTQRQIDLVSTFANQAVIAIENVRLFNETKEALEHQQTSADILRIVSQSVADSQPAFEAILAAARRLFPGCDSTVWRVDKDTLVAVARGGPTMSSTAGHGVPITPKYAHGIAILERRPVRLDDVESSPEISDASRQDLLSRGRRAILMVPFVRDGESVGAISVSRSEPYRFSDKQVGLLQAFASQAVIAIENARLFNETKEALERQTATAEILKVIASSPSDVQPVFDAIAKSSVQLFGGFSAVVTRVVGETQQLAAFTSTSEEGNEAIKGLFPVAVGELNSGKAILTKAPAWRTDTETDPDISPAARESARKRGYRSLLAVPMVREGEAIGSITVTRRQPGAFSSHQIDLLMTFADQAVIAIENVRLFNETKEALEQQTATAEILKVISGSPTDTQPVFQAIAERAARICEASDARIHVVDGSDLRYVAGFGDVPAPEIGTRRRIGRGLAIGRAVIDGRPVHVEDVQAVPHEFPVATQYGVEFGWRTVLAVPLMRENRALGAISLRRAQVRPFSEKQIALLRTFADQAAIAIENVRLFKELQERTEALTKSVGQLTALGEVGQAISSTLDLETVLKTIVARAVQLTGLDSGSIYEYDEQAEEYHLRATENLGAEVVEVLRRAPIRRNEGPVWQAGLTGKPTQITEMRDEDYQTPRREFLLRAGYRALLAVPLMRENRIVGALTVTRKAPGAFAPEVVELLKTFATQSALAIQNARLFREIAEKGKQLEVASEHKSHFLASMSHELRTPLNALLGFNEMLLGGVYGEVPGDMGPPLAQMQSSGKHLLRLINNVLDLAKIEAGRMELALAEYSVHDTVESVRSTLQPLAVEKGLDFLAAVPSEIPLAYGDPGRIAQCLMNLAGNSLKFTKSGKVEISVAMDDGLLRYRVVDTGIGIPPDKIEGLFTEFKQTDATVASEYGGTGLGLSISKKFVEMHGGRIWAESEPGRGSVFTFEVPLRAKAP